MRPSMTASRFITCMSFDTSSASASASTSTVTLTNPSKFHRSTKSKTRKTTSGARARGRSAFSMKALAVICLSLCQVAPTMAISGCSGARSNAVNNIRFRISHSLSPLTFDDGSVKDGEDEYDNWNKRAKYEKYGKYINWDNKDGAQNIVTVASAWSAGGGPRMVIPSDSGTPFAGREYGGGERSDIYGTRVYGSGYPYDEVANVDNVTSIAGKPFPFGMWPISWGSSYADLGGQEFESFAESNPEEISDAGGVEIDMAMTRPGGHLSIAQVSTSDSTRWPEIDPSKETYWIIGDQESLMFMMSDLVDWCHVTPQWPQIFKPDTINGTRPENVIQYYRASSFALAHLSFNNSLSDSAPSSTSDWPPLPASLDTSPFLKCINETIGTALPIMDPINRTQKGVGAGVVVAALIGGLMMIYGIYALTSIWVNRRDKRKAEAMREREREKGKGKESLADIDGVGGIKGITRMSRIEERRSQETQTDETEEKAYHVRFTIMEEVRRGYGP